MTKSKKPLRETIFEDLAYLENLQKSIEERAGKWDTIGYLELNAEFHNFFMEKYGNETMSELANDLHLKVQHGERGKVRTRIYIRIFGVPSANYNRN